MAGHDFKPGEVEIKRVRDGWMLVTKDGLVLAVGFRREFVESLAAVHAPKPNKGGK